MQKFPTPEASAIVHHRKDIDGLRAIAVLGVLFYHFQLPGLAVPGGFSGVDVFFVISGYLITGILLRERARDGYLLDFAMRRIRRIFPALITMIGVSLAAGYVLLIPDDYHDLAVQSRYATFALSNFYFLFNTNYFDPAAEFQVLLHTWSLAVEEQFYLVWPLLLLLLRPVNMRILGLITTAIMLASLAYSQLTALDAPKVAFYSPLSRAWELGIGALLAIVPAIRVSSYLATALKAAGIGLIAYSFFGLDATDSFPGLNALYACIGTALLIYPVAHPTLVCNLLSTAPMRGIGLISYSLYLWHWPVLVYFEHYQSSAEVSAAAGVVLISVSLLLATASYYLIETPFRQRRLSTRHNVMTGTMITLLVLLAAAMIDLTRGFNERLTPMAAALNDRVQAWRWEPVRDARIAIRNTIGFGRDWHDAQFRVLIWGDSHSDQLAPLVEQALLNEHENWAAMVYRGCSPVVDGSTLRMPGRGAAYNTYCGERSARMQQFLTAPENRPDVLILASAWYTLTPQLQCDTCAESDPVPDAVQDLAERVAEQVSEVVIFTQIPMFDFDPVPCQIGQQIGLLRDECEQLVISNKSAYNLQTDRMRQLQRSNIHVLAPGDGLCPQGRCTTSINGEFLYRDGTHFRRDLQPATRQQLSDIMGLSELLQKLR